MTTLDEALATVKAAGYVTLREASYRRAQERQRLARAERDWEIERRKSVDRWACKAYDDNRLLRDRLTFVYGVARAHGATVDELAGS